MQPGLSALVAGGRKAQPACRDQGIRRTIPRYDHGESKPSEAIESKASPHENR
jgi:hypothetical protein